MSSITYTIDFAAAIARLEEGARKGSAAVRRMADEMEAASSFARNALASIGIGLSGAAFVAGVKSASDAADAAAKMGDRFGIATEQLIGMQHAANLAGVSNEGLTTAMRGLARSGVEAAQGNEQARIAFQRLGLQASEFIKLPMDKQLSLVIDRLGGMENAAVRNATAQAVMGRQAGEVMGLVAEGSGAFEKAAEDTEAWGLALNRVDAAKIEMANDALKRAEAATKGLFTQISVALSPAVIAIANHFADARAQARGYRDEIAEGSDVVVEAIGYAANFITGLRFAWVAAKLAVAEFADFTITRLSELLSVIPNEWGNQLKLMAETTHQVSADIKAELDKLADEGLPHDQIVARIKEVSATLAVEAQKLADNRAKFMKEGGDPGIFRDEDQALRQRIAKIIDGNKLERDVIGEHLRDRQYDLDLALGNEYITQEQWEGQSAALYANYQSDLTRIQDEELKKRYGISQVYRQLDLQSSSYFFGALGAMMVSHNRAAFEIGKAAAISQTIIDTYRAAQGAYAALAGIPFVGPALGAAAAAAAIVVGLARVQQIRSTPFGGGSVSGGASPVFSANPGTGVPTAPILPPGSQSGAGGPGTIEVNVTVINQGGVMVGDDGIKQLVRDQVLPVISDAMNHDSVVLFNNNSRQQQNILAAV